MDKDTEIFRGKSLADIMYDVYNNTKKKDRQINALIGELKPFVKNLNDATILVPLIKEYLEIAVKNDEHIVKLAQVGQRLISATKTNDAGEYILSEEERVQLLKDATELGKSTDILKEELKRNSRRDG